MAQRVLLSYAYVCYVCIMVNLAQSSSNLDSRFPSNCPTSLLSHRPISLCPKQYISCVVVCVCVFVCTNVSPFICRILLICVTN